MKMTQKRPEFCDLGPIFRKFGIFAYFNHDIESVNITFKRDSGFILNLRFPGSKKDLFFVSFEDPNFQILNL